MPTNNTVKTGWLKDANGEKFAPKTLTSQVQTSDGTLLEDKVKTDIDEAVAKKTQVQFITWEAND